MSDGADKKRLLETIQKTSAETERIAAELQEAREKTYFAGELAQGMLQYYSALPEGHFTNEQWSQHTETWRGLYESAVECKPAASMSKTFWARTYGVATSSNTVLFGSSISGSVEAPQIHLAQGQIRTLLERPSLLEDVRSAMRRLGLDRRSDGGQTALSHLEASRNALGSGATPVLISMREAINTALAQLISRRPAQERASSHRDKVTSLGRQCGRSTLGEAHFATLGTNGQGLVDRLSGAKDRALTPQQVSDLLNEGLVYLNALLASLDEARLKAN